MPTAFPLTFANTALPGTPFMTQIGEAVADFWTKIGVQVTIKNVEWGPISPWNGATRRAWLAYAAMYRTAGRPVAESRYQGGFHSTGLQHLLGMRSTARPCVRSLISCMPAWSPNAMMPNGRRTSIA